MATSRPRGRGRNDDALLVGRGGSIRSLAARVTADNVRVHCYPNKEFNGASDINGNVSDAVRVMDINALSPDTDYNHPGAVGYFLAVNTGFYESQNNDALMSGGIHVGGVYTFKDATSLVGSQYESVFYINNVPGYDIDLPTTASFASGAIYRAQGGNTVTVTADANDFNSGLVASTDGSSTLTVARMVNFNAATLVGTGATLTERIGLRIVDVPTANLGTVTTQVGVEIPVLKFATTNHAIRIGSSTTTTTFTANPATVMRMWPSTYVADYASARFPRMIDVLGTFQYKQSANVLLSLVGTWFAPNVQNEITAASGLGNTVGFYAGVTHVADSQAIDGGSVIDFLSNQSFSVAATGGPAGSFTTVSGFGVQSQMVVNTGAVVTERRGFSFVDKTGAGILTTQYGIYIPALANGLVNWGVYCLADVLLGANVYGSTSSGGNLTLRSTTSATKGYVVAADSLKVFAADRTYIATAAEPVIQVESARTLTTSSTGSPTLPAMVDFNPSLVLAVAGGANPVFGFRMRPTVTNSSTSSWSTGNLGRGFIDTTTFDITSTQTGVTVGSYLSHRSSPTFANNSAGAAGTATMAAWASFSAGAPTAIATGWTITAWRHYEITDAANASIGTQVGVEIPVLTAATTANIGLRNASITVYTPTTQTITATGNTIAHTATNIRLNNTSGSSKTLASTPTITDGQDGEVVIITNTSANDVVLQDGTATLVGSNLRLVATTRTLSTRDSITLKFDGTIGDWVEIAFSNVI